MKRRAFLVGSACAACAPAPAAPRSVAPQAPVPRAASPRPDDNAPEPTIPFGMYSAPPARMEALAAAGFTWAGPFYPRELELSPNRLGAAAKAQLGALVPIGWHRGRSHAGEPIPWDPHTAERKIADAVAAHADDETVAGWYLVPEELSAWVEQDLAYLELAARTIRAADPKQRPIVGYQPNVRGAELLRPISQHLDALAKGTYVNYSGHRAERAWARWSVQQVVEGASENTLPLAALEMFQDPSDAAASEIERWVRHDVLLSLCSGARGVLVFSGWERPNFDRYDDYFAAYLKVVGEVHRPGVATALLRGQIVRALPSAGPTTVDASLHRGTFQSPSLTARAAGPITVVVNSAPEPIVCRLPDTAGQVEAGDGAFYECSALLHLPAYGSAVIAT